MTRTATALSLLLLAAGCSQEPLYRRAPVPLLDAGDWGPLRDAASRRATLYDGLDHRATASVTWLSPEVREAGVRRLAEWKGMGPAETEEAVARGRADAALGEEFLVAVYTAERRNNDLDATSSVWHLELDDGQVRVPASTVTAIRDDATIRQLYDYVGGFDQVYRVRFNWTGPPLPGRPFTLRLGGSLGAMVFDFGSAGLRTLPPRLSP